NPYSVDSEGATAAVLAKTNGFQDLETLIADPTQWGRSDSAETVSKEIAQVQRALEAGSTIETLDGNADKYFAGIGVVEETGPVEGKKIESPEIKQAIIQAAKKKPMVALNGSTIKTEKPKTAVVESMLLAGYREQPVSVKVDRVSGDTAHVSHLNTSRNGDTAPMSVTEGSMIPGTSYRVESVESKYIRSKQGQGSAVDVSRVMVKDTQTGNSHLLVADVSNQAADTYAILTSPNSEYRYVVKTGDVFRTYVPERGERDYQVLDVRPSGVVVKDLADERVMTITRDGVR
ncbi:MAG: hypothetical protein AAF226_18820, partial [Verrucomicrobiota bacterium]